MAIRIPYLAPLAAGLVLGACGAAPAPDPSADELSALFGIPVSDVSCFAAAGNPNGYAPSCPDDSFTRRIIQLDNGSWKAVAN